MNRPPLFTNNSLLPPNLAQQQQLNGKQSNQNQQMNPAQQLKTHPLLPLPSVNAPVVRLMTNAPLTMSFANRPPIQTLNHPFLNKHPNLTPNRLPLVAQQPTAASLARLPNPNQLLQNPPPNPASLLPPVSQARPHLINPSIKPPHLLQTPLIANSLLSSNPLVPQSITQNGIQNSPLLTTTPNEQTNVNKSPANDLQCSPSNGQHNVDKEDSEQKSQTTDSGETWVETTTNDGKVYFYNSKTRETSWNKPENKQIITHEQFMQQQQLTQMKSNSEIKPQENSFPHQMPFQPMPGVIPPFAQFPMHPQLMMPPMIANMAANSQNMFMIPPEIRMAAMEWMEYKTPQGKSYYFSNKTQQSVWDKPKALLDLEQAMNKLKNEQNQPKNTIQNKEEKKVDKNKPVSSTPIAGTPWCLVKTGDDRVFFFNPSTKTSVWQRPKDLENNEEVDRLLNDEESSKREIEIEQEQKTSTITQQQKETNSLDQQQAAVQVETIQNNASTDEKSNSSSLNVDSNKDDAVTPASNNNIKRNPAEEEIGSNKKQKVSAEEDSRKQMGITSIEAIASKQREQIPLEERIEMFTKMLEEKGVSAFSTWEKELFKIVFDSRYLLLTSKERKQTFDKYTRERVDKERKEKLNKSKKQRQDFRDFLRDKFKEHKYSTRLTYAEFAKKHSSSEQFKLIEKIRDREQLFHEFVDELKKKERDEKQREKDKAKENFLELLRENQKLFDRHSHFSEMRDRFRDDPRYKALQTSQKEDLFRIFISNLPSASSRHSKRSHSREKHHKSSSDKHNSSQDRSSSKFKDKLSADRMKGENPDESPLIKTKQRQSEELDEGELNSSANESEGEFKLEKDCEQTVDASELTEEERKDLEKKKRIERSLKAREKQVQKEMQGHLEEREKHRNMFKKQELVENFNILLIDLIRNPDLSYREAKKVLKKDHRYDTFESLSRNEKEDLFDAHINNLIKKKRKIFIELLEETKGIKLNSSWREVRRLIKEDPRYLQLSEKRCEKEFQYFLKEKLMRAKNDFKCLLKETKLITHKSRKLIETSDQQHLADIIVHLQNDKRYLDLDLIEDERRQLIIDYIEHLAKQGTPPPVTSSSRK